MPTHTILIVDEDEMLRRTLSELLAAVAEFEVVSRADAASGIEAARRDPVDLVIMDVALPDMDGRAAVRRLRKSGFRKPIVILAASDTDADTILGLEAGANDYVAKPFRFAVLLARIRTQLRQYAQSEDAVLTVGPYLFKPKTKQMVDGERTVRLTEKESNIIRFLLQADGEVVTRERLLEEVWGYNSGVTTHTLETHIYRLRQKIERTPANSDIVVTESGGYKIVT